MIVTRQRRKPFPWKRLILPVIAVALVSFNLGVEAGQLAIVCIILPLAYLCRHSRLYSRLILGLGSLAIVTVAFVWLLERSLNVEIFS